MSDNVLDYLREQFRRVNEKLDKLTTDGIETRSRLLAIERHLAGVRRDAALDAETTAGVQQQVDRLSQRLDRIERRLDLAEDAGSIPATRALLNCRKSSDASQNWS